MVHEHGDAWDQAGLENRSILVCYPSNEIVNRNGGQLHSRHDPLGNFVPEQEYRKKGLNVAAHGVVACGGAVPHAQHCASEAVMQLFNSLAASGIRTTLDAQSIMKTLSIKLDNQAIGLDPIGVDPAANKDATLRMLGLWSWHHALCSEMLIHIPRPQFKARFRAVALKPHDPSQDALKDSFEASGISKDPTVEIYTGKIGKIEQVHGRSVVADPDRGTRVRPFAYSTYNHLIYNRRFI